MYFPLEYYPQVLDGSKFEKREGEVLSKEVSSWSGLCELLSGEDKESLRKKDVTVRVKNLLLSGTRVKINYELGSGYCYIMYEGRRVFVFRAQVHCVKVEPVTKLFYSREEEDNYYIKGHPYDD